MTDPVRAGGGWDLATLKFIYLEFGGDVMYRRELKYSASTLLAEIPEASANIVLYTDAPEAYEHNPHVEVVDISARLPEIIKTYMFRAKAWVLLETLRRYGRPCVFLDTDTFVRPGFAQALRQKMARGGVMNAFLRRNPFPSLAGFETTLPHAGAYRYDPAQALMYNSGLIAVQVEHAPIIEDALFLMDQVHPLTCDFAHDQEQFSINEAFRVHGVPLECIDVELVHYCSRWWKRYMRWRLQREPDLDGAPVAPAQPRIRVNKSIARLFKFVWLSNELATKSISYFMVKKRLVGMT